MVIRKQISGVNLGGINLDEKGIVGVDKQRMDLDMVLKSTCAR